MATVDEINLRIAATDRASGVIGNIVSKLGGLKVIAAGAGIAIAGAIAYKSVKAFGEFDEAMRNSLAMFDNFGGELAKKMAVTARKIGKTTEHSATDAARAFYYLGSAGISASDSLKLVGAIADFSTAMQLDMADASEIAAISMNAFGKTAEDVPHIMDVLATTVKNAQTNMQQLKDAFSYVAPVAASFGQDVETVSAALGIMANAGIQGSMAGTALRRILINLATPSGKAAKAIEALKLQVYDESGHMRNLIDILKDVKAKTDEMSEAERNAALEAIAGTRGVSALVAMLASLSDENVAAGKSIDAFKTKIATADGTVKEMGKYIRSSFNNQMKILKGQLNDVFITIGSKLVPILIKLIGVFKKVGGAIIAIFKGDFSKAKDLLVGFGNKIKAFFAKLPSRLFAIGKAVAKAFVTGLFKIGNILNDWATKLGKIDFFKAGKNAAKGLMNWIKNLVKGAKKGTEEAEKETGKGLGSIIIDFFKGFFRLIWELIKGLIGFVAGFATEIGKALINAIVKGAKKLWEKIKDWFVGLGKKIVKAIIGGLKKAADTIWDGIKGVGDKIIGGFKKIFGISSPSKVFMQYGRNLVEGLNEGITKTKVATIPAPNVGMPTAPNIGYYGGVATPNITTTPTQNNINVHVTTEIKADIRNYSDLMDLADRLAEAVNKKIVEGITVNVRQGR